MLDPNTTSSYALITKQVVISIVTHMLCAIFAPSRAGEPLQDLTRLRNCCGTMFRRAHVETRRVRRSTDRRNKERETKAELALDNYITIITLNLGVQDSVDPGAERSSWYTVAVYCESQIYQTIWCMVR